MDFWLFSKITRTVITYQNQGFDVYLEQWLWILRTTLIITNGPFQYCEGILFSLLKLRVHGQVFVTWTGAHILLLVLAKEPNIRTSLLLDLDLKLESWKTFYKIKAGSLSRQLDFFF
jgi:hypothetical protein